MQGTQPRIIHLRGPAPQAFDFASLAEEYGRACTHSVHESLAATAGATPPSSDSEIAPRHLAEVAAHFARRAMGER